MKLPYTRLAVRLDEPYSEGHLVLGKSFHGCLEPGMVYEIVNVMGDLTIKKVGISVATVAAEASLGEGKRPVGAQIHWGHTVGQVVESGDHLLTVEEVDERTFRSYCETVRDGCYTLDEIDLDYVDRVWTAVKAAGDGPFPWETAQ